MNLSYRIEIRLHLPPELKLLMPPPLFDDSRFGLLGRFRIWTWQNERDDALQLNLWEENRLRGIDASVSCYIEHRPARECNCRFFAPIQREAFLGQSDLGLRSSAFHPGHYMELNTTSKIRLWERHREPFGRFAYIPLVMEIFSRHI
jgi:hypothetical protein